MTERQKISRREMIRGGVSGSWIAKLFGKNRTFEVKKDQAGLTPMPPIATRRYPESAPDLPTGGPSRSRPIIPILRPPGAIDEPAFLAECTRCDACLEACPHDAIIHAPVRMRNAARTPMIDPIRQPCWLCDDRPCINACEPGVLRHDLETLMGTARITEETCLAFNGSFCSVCSEQCPVQGAIEVTNGQPHIVERNCTGCGVCQYVCPAPHNAILLMPALQRATKPNQSAGETDHE